ncbi:MAG: DUF4398 domain-containing protein [Pseudomonadota bacterium]|nr:DUF4398 domain-containing protein [Pseudomonadota bacterium]
MKTTFTERMDLPSICAMLVAIGGCVGAPPTDTVSPAEVAVNRAIEVKAGEYAPLELRLAQESLEGARQAMNDEDYEQAHRLAETALVDAQLAEAKAQSEAARKQAQEIQSTIDTLRQEAEQRVR